MRAISPAGLVVMLFAARVGAQPVDPANLLQTATDKIDRASDRLPDFTCIATVQRRLYRRQALLPRQATNAEVPAAPGSRDVLLWSDRLRVEVAMVHGEQLFSWPGDEGFRYRDVAELAGGAASAGEFGPFGISVLLSDADPMSLRFLGIADSSLARYAYSVPRSSSHFHVQGAGHEETLTAYEGSFLIDPHTADLKRLVVDIVHPPPQSEIVGGEITIDYGPQSLDQTTAWLPRSSTLRMLNDRGDLVMNDSDYGQCRHFHSESKVSFDEAQPEATTRVQIVRSDSLAPGLLLHTAFQTGIDAGRTCAGDEIELRVVKPVERRGEVLLPAGARVFGRVVELRRIYQPTPGVILAIRFDRVEFNGLSQRIALGAVGPAALVPVPAHSRPQQAATISISGATKLHISAGTKWDWQTR